MRAYIEGFKKVSFTGDSGDTVTGMRVYYTYRDPAGVGLACDSFFVRADTGVADFLSGWTSDCSKSELSEALGIGCTLDFDRKGRLLSVDFLDSSGVPFGDSERIKGGECDA